MNKSYILFILVITIFGSGCRKTSEPEIIPITPDFKDYVVLAWNDLGMHCLNPVYTQAVILPPYNTVYAQVIKRGDPPQVITEGISLEYQIVGNTYSYGKRDYSTFWDNANSLFGVAVEKNKGLTGNGLSGLMSTSGDHFIVTGIPVTPVKDDGTWSPFQVGEIIAKDNAGHMIASTRFTVPTSDEIHCDGCHIPNSLNNHNPFLDILQHHDKLHQPPDGLLVPAAPVLCARCHGAPELGTTGPGDAGKYLSAAIHRAHASRTYPDGSSIACYSCHPGPSTHCSRSLKHMREDGNCTTCHGDMLNVATTINNNTRIPWVNEPKCVSCHTGVTEVNTDTLLYRNSRGHGQIYCAGCHGSPHAMYPSREAGDNYQPNQYQNFATRIKSIGSCGGCHDNSRGPGSSTGTFISSHGGLNPRVATGCNICHTNVKSITESWPHAFGWMNSNYKK